jgi:RNA polymerase sigma-70 factor (ECF subfamily)
MDGFRDLYERYYPDVFRFALFLTGDVARAEDLTADTFVRAWTARDRIRQETVRAYLLTITRNLFRDYVRTAQPHVTLDERLQDGSPMADARVERASALQQVRARLRHVARGDRRALLLYVVREMSYSEIAAALGVSVGAVKSRIFRAREALATPPAIAYSLAAAFPLVMDMLRGQPFQGKSLFISVVFATIAFASTIGWLTARRRAV